MRTFVKMIVAIIVATGMVLIMAQHGVGFKACMVAYFCVGIMTAAILGVFDADKSARVKGRVRSTFGRLLPQGRKKSEKFATARRGYRRAA